MKCAAILSLLLISTSLWANPNPCGQVDNPSSDPYLAWIGAWQDCNLGEWTIKAQNDVYSGIIFASKPLTVLEKSHDGPWGYIHHMKDAKQIYFHFVMNAGEKRSLRFKADADTHVALKLLTGQSAVVGAMGELVQGNIDLTNPQIPHLFFLTPNKDQVFNKGEIKTIEWVSSTHFERIFVSIGRSPYQASYIRTPGGSQAFYIDNILRFEWDVLKINSACHDFYLTISGYANDGSGYHKFTSEIFSVLHDIAPGFVCPEIQK